MSKMLLLYRCYFSVILHQLRCIFFCFPMKIMDPEVPAVEFDEQ